MTLWPIDGAKRSRGASATTSMAAVLVLFIGGCAALTAPMPQIGGHPAPLVALEIPRPRPGDAHLILMSGFPFDLAIIDESGRSFGVVTRNEVIVLRLPAGKHRLFAYRPSMSILTFCGNHCGVGALVANVRDGCMYDAYIDYVREENWSSFAPPRSHDQFTAHPAFKQLRPERPLTWQTRLPIKVPMSMGPLASELAKEASFSGARQLAERRDPQENVALDPTIADCTTLMPWENEVEM